MTKTDLESLIVEMTPAWEHFQNVVTDRTGIPLHPEQPLETGACVYTSLILEMALKAQGHNVRTLSGKIFARSVDALRIDDRKSWHDHTVAVCIDNLFVDLTARQFDLEPIVAPLDSVNIQWMERKDWRAQRFDNQCLFATQGNSANGFGVRSTAQAFVRHNPEWFARFQDSLMTTLKSV